MVNRVPTNLRLTEQDRDLIGRLQCDTFSILKETMKRPHMLSMTDVIRVAVHHLADHIHDPGVAVEACGRLFDEDFMMLWGKDLALAKRFKTRAEAEAVLDEVGETVYDRKVKRKAVGAVTTKGREHPIVIIDLDDGRRFFLESTS